MPSLRIKWIKHLDEPIITNFLGVMFKRISLLSGLKTIALDQTFSWAEVSSSWLDINQAELSLICDFYEYRATELARIGIPSYRAGSVCRNIKFISEILLKNCLWLIFYSKNIAYNWCSSAVWCSSVYFFLLKLFQPKKSTSNPVFNIQSGNFSSIWPLKSISS